MLLLTTLLTSVFPVIIILYFIYNRGVSEIFNNPVVLTNLFFLIIHVLLPYLQWNHEYFRYSTYEIDTYIYSMLYVSFLNVFYSFVLIFFIKNLRASYSNLTLSKKSLNKIFSVSFFVLLIGSICVYFNIKAILALGVEEYIKDRISLGVGNGVYLLLSHWVYIASILFLYIYLNAKNYTLIRRISALLFLTSFLISIAYYSINSNRNSIFLLLLNLMAVYFSFNNSFKSRMTYRQLKSVFILLFVSFFIVGAFFQLGKLRHSGYEESNQSSNYSLVKALNGAFGNHENIVWLLNNDFEYHYGNTYLAAVTNFVPRSIWPSKPTGAGPILKNEIYPGSYVVGQAGNSSLTTGLYTEVIINFGFLASIFAILFIAGFVSSIYTLLASKAKGIGYLILIFTIVVFSSQFLYAEFLGFLVRYIFSVIPLVLCYFIQSGDLKNEANSTRYG